MRNGRLQSVEAIVDIAEVQTAQGKLYLFVPIDRASKFAVARLVDKPNTQTARAFLEALSPPRPTRSTPCSPTTEWPSPTCPRTDQGRPPGPAAPFDRACREHEIEHRLTKPNHPWTTDVIDKRFLTGSELFSSRARATAWRRARARGASPAAQPSLLPLLCGARARPLGAVRIPAGDEAGVGRLRCSTHLLS
jgi:transposase InsO family protein